MAMVILMTMMMMMMVVVVVGREQVENHELSSCRLSLCI